MSKRYFPKLTIANIYSQLKQTLKLQWLGGECNSCGIIQISSQEQTSLVGYLNLIHQYPIIIIGSNEYQYLANLDSMEYKEVINNIFHGKSLLVVIADAQSAPEEIVNIANEKNVALLTSPFASQTVINHLIYFLNTNLAESITLHGVFMEIFDVGVLICGDSGCGKSEIALELITRQHRLIADDAPQFMRITPTTIIGKCPELLQEFIEVRGLGILNVKKMFGDIAIKDRKQLQLIINLLPANLENLANIERLNSNSTIKQILDVAIPEINIPITAGNNLATLIEVATRNQILKNNGYNAADNFIKLQNKAIEESKITSEQLWNY